MLSKMKNKTNYLSANESNYIRRIEIKLYFIKGMLPFLPMFDGLKAEMIANRVLKCDIIKFSFLHFSIFMTIFQQNMMKNPHTPNLTQIGSW